MQEFNLTCNLNDYHHVTIITISQQSTIQHLALQLLLIIVITINDYPILIIIIIDLQSKIDLNRKLGNFFIFIFEEKKNSHTHN